MIPVTPDIIGPGIEEEYDGALPRLDRILEILKDVKPGNDTFEARVVANCQWLRRMILERTMPIPLDRSYWSTLGYVMGDMTFAVDNPELNQKIYDVVVIVKGSGLLKPRHYPVAVALIRDLIDVMNRDLQPLSSADAAAIHELGDMIRWIEHHGAQLPLDEDAFPNVGKLGKNPKFVGGTDLLGRFLGMSRVIFAGGRPIECFKGPLAAPVPGLPTTPPSRAIGSATGVMSVRPRSRTDRPGQARRHRPLRPDRTARVLRLGQRSVPVGTLARISHTGLD